MNKFFNRINFVFLFIGIILGASLVNFDYSSSKSTQEPEEVSSELSLPSNEVSDEISRQVALDKNVVVYTSKLGENFIYVQAIGNDCGSCHQSYIYIFDKKNRKVFEVTSDDAQLGYTTGEAFSLIEPIRKENEPYCCPTSHKTRIFNWKNNTFVEMNKEMN